MSYKNNMMFLNQCVYHKNHKIRFVCLNDKCKKESLGCVFCIKSNHSTCKQELVLDYALLGRIIEIRKGDDLSDLKEKISVLIDENFNHLNQLLKLKKKEILNSYDLYDKDVSSLSVEQLLVLKKNLDVTYDPQTKKIILKNPLTNNFEKRDCKIFQEEVQQKLSKAQQLFNNLKFQNSLKLNSSDFFYDEQIKITQNFNQLILLNTSKSRSYHYKLMYKYPLINEKFKITFFKDSLNGFQIFIIDENLFKKFQSKLITQEILQDMKNKQTIYNLSQYEAKNLKGDLSFQQEFLNSQGQHLPLDQINKYSLYLNFNKNNKKLEITSDDGKVDLQNTSVSVEHNLYFVITSNSPKQKIILEKLLNQ